MSERLKELLDKINQEGVKQAEERARAIEAKAKDEAKRIIGNAKAEAQKIAEKAHDDAKKIKESTETTLKQAARDLVLSLKEEIKNILNKLISIEIKKAMSTEEIKAILENLILKYIEKNGKSSDLKILLNKDDLERLRDTFILKLQEKIKSGIEFSPSGNINTGFSVSFDKGRSFFDFSDEGIKEAFSAFLNQELAGLLK